MFKIGEFSKLCGLSANTLYHYEQKGILLPASIDDTTGYRYYDATQLVAVNKILALKDAGFSLDEIAAVLRNNIHSTALIEILEAKATSLEAALCNEANRLKRLRSNIFLIKNGGIPHTNDISIKKVEAILVASIRKTVPINDIDSSVAQMWPAVNEYIDAQQGKRTIPCLMVYHSVHDDMRHLNLAYEKDTLDIEVAEPVTAAFTGNDEAKPLQSKRATAGALP